MTNDNNTRKKANAVFFSVIMVISMVAVGFAAAPAAADNATSGDITFNDQYLQDGDVTASVESLTGGNNATVLLTYSSGSDTIIAGATTVEDVSTPEDVAVTVDDTGGFPGDHTAHLFNVSTVDASNVNAGNNLTAASIASSDALASDSATVSNPDGASREAGEDIVFNNTNVYQGEDDLTFVDDGSTTFNADELEGTAGNREGTPLQLPIPENADRGTYADNGAAYDNDAFAVTVREPQINTAEVQLQSGTDDISQVGSDNAGNLEIVGEWNFGEAEDLELTVEDPSGADITDEVTSDTLEGGSDSVNLDLGGEDAGEYTIRFEGADDLDYDAVVEEYTIEVTNQNTLSIDTASDTVTQGTNLEYTVSGGTNGNFHAVVIDSDDFRDNIDSDVFRNVEDVANVGFANSSNDDIAPANANENADVAYAVVEIDGTEGVGSIRSSTLTDTSVDIELYESSTEAFNYSSSFDSAALEDDDTFSVEEGDVTLDSPTGEYTIGNEVDVNGTASSADRVGIYVRDNNNWEPVSIDGGDSAGSQVISVDSDDTFEETDIVLSDQSVNTMTGSNVLAFEGRYDIGVVDMADVNDEGAVLDNSDFSSASSARYTINTVQGDLSASFETYNGQIATSAGDQITVSGTAEGQDSVVYVFVDRRGQVVNGTTSVDNDGTFEEEDISLGTLAQGQVTGHILSIGRDNQVGDGSTISTAQGSSAVDDLSNYVGGLSGSGDQVRSRIVSNTVEADGSDDLIVTESFRVNDGTLSIRDVYPEEAQSEGVNPVATGETMVIAGDTNRNPDNAAITLDVLTSEGEDPVASASTDEWGTDGQWSATVDTSDLDTGTYIIEADDGDNTDRVTIEIVEERQTEDGDDGSTDGDDGSTDGDDGSTDGDDGSTDGDDGSSDGDDGSMDGDDGGSDGEDGGSDGGDGGTDDSTPGFGALVALVALIAAALLATRRND